MRNYVNWVYVAALAGLLTPMPLSTASADAGDILVRLRGVAFLPDVTGSADDGPTNIGGTDTVTDDAIPELDITYFITKHIAAELVLATTKHDVTVKDSTLGEVDLGTVRLLPPVVTLQYHFLPDGKYRPYIGAGINYTITFDESEGIGGGGASITNIKYSNEFGYAFQVGMDITVKDNWFFNIDVKKVFVKTDINVNDGAILSNDTELNPWLIGVGFGYRF